MNKTSDTRTMNSTKASTREAEPKKKKKRIGVCKEVANAMKG